MDQICHFVMGVWLIVTVSDFVWAIGDFKGLCGFCFTLVNALIRVQQ